MLARKSATLQDAAAAVDVGVFTPCDQYTTAVFQVNSLVGTVTFVASIDGGTFSTVTATDLQTGASKIQTAQNGLYRLNVGSLNFVGSVLSNLTAGNPTVLVELSDQ